jgi:hypothetical protein
VGLPDPFADDISGALAANGARLWLFVSGLPQDGPHAHIDVRAYERSEGEQWRLLPRLPGSDFDSYVAIGVPNANASRSAGACVAYHADGQPFIRCLVHGRWTRARGLPEGRETRIADFEQTKDGGLAVLLSQSERGYQSFVVATSRDGRQWSQRGPRLEPGRAIAQLLTPEDALHPRVAIERQSKSATRDVMALVDDQWVRDTPKLRAPLGPQVGGPVVVDGRIFFPVVSAARQPWPFSVATYAGGDHWSFLRDQPLSRGDGSAQGSLGIVDGEPWAIWQEDGRGPDNLFQTYVRVVAVNGDGTPLRAPSQLWHGLTVGPGSVQLLDAGGGSAYALYMRGNRARKGLQLSLAKLTPHF